MENTSSSSFRLLAFLLISFHIIATCLAMNISTDQSSLLALKAHVTPDPYHILSKNWSSSTSVCNWIGITCGSRHQRVTVLNISELSRLRKLIAIDISSNGLNGSNVLSVFNISSLDYLGLMDASLTGDLPSDLCRRLPRLQKLFLSSNMLSGEIPRSISECSELQVLALMENNFLGTIPGELGNLQLLKVLDIGFNNFEGTIPYEIGHLYNLELLAMDYNKLTGSVPYVIGRLYKLEYLSMERNKLTGSIPLSIFNISSLEYLSIGDNKLEGPLPREVGNLSMLQVLDFSMNNLTGVIPHGIGNLQELEDLSLSYNNFKGSIPIGIFNISSLIYLQLAGNHISANLPSTIGHGLPNVEGIHLSGNNINGVLPSSISNMSKLMYLELYRNELTGSIPESLGNLRLLEVLGLSSNSFNSELSFITPLANCKYLRKLILSSNPLNAMLPKSIGNLSSLEMFLATGCNLKGHIPNEVGNLRNLSSLELEDNDFNGIVPMTISSLKNLQRLSLGANRISGPFPIALCELSNLALLNLSQNQMWGSLPSCLGDMTSLREVSLDSNNFIAIIPSNLWTLKDILKLNLSSNFFNGSLPLEVGNLKAAILLDLSWNQILGNIPSTLGSLQKLTHLFLAHNRIEGSIPEAFGGLKSLEVLDLSYNNLSGVIPKSLEALKYLHYFNVSFNRLHGEITNEGPFVHLPYQSFMSNEGLCGNSQNHVPTCPSNSKDRSKSKKERLMRVVVASSVFSVIGLASAIVFLLMRRRGKTTNTEDEWLPEVAPQRISYYELQRATQGFDGNNLLGSGSFGSVYKGTLADGIIVAVKVFNVQMESTFQTFDRECDILRNLRHKNLTKIITSCCNLDFKALIFEYMPNESLDKLLYSRDYCLNIMQRLNIMVDVASALEYLHHGYSVPVIHCDMKPSNVLLDNDMVGHLTDFGIAKLLTMEESIAHTTTFATIGYIAPEYGMEGLVYKRSDVYSYGIMLLETFTKKKPNDEMFVGDMNLRSCVHNLLPDELDQIIDADLLTVDEENLSRKMQCVASIMELAMNCTANIPVERIT
ncbi:probable LRR receptor-like serine/threonine-protein kinase At3g47570 [Nicotiana sylvestris]|uniref:non-specific serine/threonine protein kinase n=1 Tax=Nicotiana sylvestris TaxID=4096 RepID=A0A1U7WES2_NICSY|nr:PREDICTED: probable LRR receptor-like serine/threonine-protein kinase At3g47570 isoform X2 [Nicotiana sylvestris]